MKDELKQVSTIMSDMQAVTDNVISSFDRLECYLGWVIACEKSKKLHCTSRFRVFKGLPKK